MRKAHEVEHAGAFALQVRSHGNHRPDGDHARAAHAGDQQVVGRLPVVCAGAGQGGHTGLEGLQRRSFERASAFAQTRAAHADEAGAKPLGAAVVFVAAALVNAALAPQCGGVGLHGHAVALHGAVAAAFAHGFVDEQALFGVGQAAFFAAAAFFCGAGLFVDQHGHAVHFAQAPLHGIEFAAVMELGARRKTVAQRGVFADVVTHHHHGAHAFAFHLARNRIDGDDAIHRLPARHGHSVVEQNFVGDARTRCHRLANGQVARVVVGAIAQVLEHVRGARKACVGHPVHPFAAHLDQPGGAALHPVGHEVAANASARRRAFGHPRAGVVRAARAEVGHAAHAVAGVGQQGRGGEVTHMLQVVAQRGIARKVARQPLRHQLNQARGAQLAHLRHQRLALQVVFAHQGGALLGRGVVEQLAQLLLDHGAFFFNHQNFPQPLGKLACTGGFQREGQPHFVQAHACTGEHLGADLQAAQHFHEVVVGLAAGDDAHLRVFAGDDVAVNAVDLGKSCHGCQFVVQARFQAQRGQVGPAVVQAVFWWLVACALAHGVAVVPGGNACGDGVEVHGGAAFHHF